MCGPAAPTITWYYPFCPLFTVMFQEWRNNFKTEIVNLKCQSRCQLESIFKSRADHARLRIGFFWSIVEFDKKIGFKGIKHEVYTY
jgi:hypothetical protein